MQVLVVFFGLILTVLFVAAIVYFAHVQKQAWLAALRAVAGRWDLHYDEGSLFRAPVVDGVVDGHRVVVDSYTVSTGKSSTTYTRIRVSAEDSGGLALSAEHLFTAIGKALTGEDVLTGDRAFDDAVLVKAPSTAEALSRLDRNARGRVQEAVQAGTWLANGEWTFRRTGLIRDPERLCQAVETVLAAARAVELRGRTRAGGLLANAQAADLPSVRARNLQCFVEEGGAGTGDLIPFLSDADPVVRFVAARGAGPEGFDVLAEYLATAGRRGVEAAVALAGRSDDPRFEGVRAAVQRVLLDDVKGGQPENEVLRALGRIGTLEAVEPLLAIAKGVWPGEGKRFAREAIRAIQARAGPAEAGALSLASFGEVEGAVSLADTTTEAGSLSLAERTLPRENVAEPRPGGAARRNGQGEGS